MSVLVVAPHMDDEVLGCAGLIQRRDDDVHVVFCTEAVVDTRLGDRGYVAYDGERRVAEMEQVADLLGFDPVRLRYLTHELDKVPTRELVARLEGVLSWASPDLLLIPAPSHDQDHEAARRACMALIRPHCFSGTVLEYHTWGVPAPYEPVAVLPLSSVEIARKAEAMALYGTQVEPGSDAYPYSVDSLRSYAAAAGRYVHALDGEAFTPRRIKL